MISPRAWMSARVWPASAWPCTARTTRIGASAARSTTRAVCSKMSTMDLGRMLDKCIRDQWSIDDLDWTVPPPQLPRDKEEAVVQYFTDMAGDRAARRRAVRGAARQDRPIRRSRRSSRRSSPTRSATPPSPRGSRSTTTSTTTARTPRARRSPRSGRTSSRSCENASPEIANAYITVGRADPRRRAAPLARRLRRRRDEPPGDAPDQPRRVAPHRDRLPHDRELRVRRVPRVSCDSRPRPGVRELASRHPRAGDDDVVREAVPPGGVPRADGSHRSERRAASRRRSSASSC